MSPASARYTPLSTQPALQVDDYDAEANVYAADQAPLAPTDHGLANRTPFFASSSSSSTELNSMRTERPSSRTLLYPVATNPSLPSSVCSTASATPVPSRTASPLYVQDDCGSSCSSDSEDSESESTLLQEMHRRRFSYSETPRWWTTGPPRRRRRGLHWVGALRWAFRRFLLPFIPKTPLTIVRVVQP